MGYPWGDMAYPTFEKAERGAEAFAGTFYAEYEHLLYQVRQLNVLRGNAKFDGMFIAPGKDDAKSKKADSEAGTEASGTSYDEDEYDDDDSYPSVQQECDAAGIALARAFRAAGIDDEDFDYLIRDIAAILEDKIVSTADKENGDYSENAYKNETLERYRATLADDEQLEREKKYVAAIDGEDVVEWYKENIAKLEEETAKFEADKIAETKERCRKRSDS